MRRILLDNLIGLLVLYLFIAKTQMHHISMDSYPSHMQKLQHR